MKSLTAKIFFGLICLLAFVQIQAQYTIPERPVNDQWLIYDYASKPIMSSAQKEALNQKLINYELRTSTQIVIVILESLKDEDINFLGAKWGQKWGIGQSKEDNGLLILLSPNDRKTAIQTGYGIEEFITDARSRRIIDNVMIPEFKNQNYYAGLDKGTNVIMDYLAGNFYEDETGQQETGNEAIPNITILVLFALIIYILYKSGGKGGGRGGRRRKNKNGDIIFTDVGRSVWIPGSFGGGFGRGSGGFDGGGFGSGGFGGFGGGGFGGGGASGSW